MSTYEGHPSSAYATQDANVPLSEIAGTVGAVSEGIIVVVGMSSLLNRAVNCMLKRSINVVVTNNDR